MAGEVLSSYIGNVLLTHASTYRTPNCFEICFLRYVDVQGFVAMRCVVLAAMSNTGLC